MITINHKGSFKNTEKFFKKSLASDYLKILERYGQIGVNALSLNTPIDSGETASSWRYNVKTDDKGAIITWSNSHVNDGIPIAILIQYGHGTKSGKYVQGRDFINPALRPVFDKLADEVWREVIT